jgi:hypothetical protein
MDNTTLSKNSVAFGLALAITCVVNAIVVIIKEKNAAVMDAMKKMTGHHWITHSTLVVVLFVGLGALFAQSKGGHGVAMTANRLIGTVISGVVLASLLIIGFYLIAD